MPEFFTDRDLGKQFPEALRLAGLTVHAAHEHFAHDTPDTVWIAEVSRRGWIALTRDQRIRYKPNELALLRTDTVLETRGIIPVCALPQLPHGRAVSVGSTTTVALRRRSPI